MTLRRSMSALPLALSFCFLYLRQSLAQAPRSPDPTRFINKFEIVGNSLVSAQQMFLGTHDKVYIVDKVEGNPVTINNHPAWASEYSVSTNNARPMDVITNSFCAGGNLLGNGTWMNVGGNAAVTFGGLDAPDQTGASVPYDDPDGGHSVRLLTPCDDASCNWFEVTPMTTRRWYPTLETLEDGTMIILGGCQFGGFVNDISQDNPTYEFFPSKGDPIGSPILRNTLPANLYPLTWLLPSGNLLIQSNWQTAVLDYKANKEYPLDNIPDAVRTYPASAGNVLLPMTSVDNWTATILFCGGTNLQPDQWKTSNVIVAIDASSSCVKLSPDVSHSYVTDDPLPEGRSMGNLILLPDGRVFCLNGAAKGTAGYGNTTWAIGQSFADRPLMSPIIYDPKAPAGSRWSREGLSASTVPRMYHSSATLLPDGSVLVSGSNPNSDYNVGPGVTYPTEYRVERFYPSYYNERRPQPQGLPQQLSYGGPYFDVSVSREDLFGNVNNIASAAVVVIRPGFSTHTMNMGQRMLTLDSSYTGNPDGTATLHVSQLPPNPAIFPPGPAYIFVVVKGVPSVGVQVMLGSGQLGPQTALQIAPLPASNIITAAQNTPNTTGNGVGSSGQPMVSPKTNNGAASRTLGMSRGGGAGLLLPLLLLPLLFAFAVFL